MLPSSHFARKQSSLLAFRSCDPTGSRSRVTKSFAQKTRKSQSTLDPDSATSTRSARLVYRFRLSTPRRVYKIIITDAYGVVSRGSRRASRAPRPGHQLADFACWQNTAPLFDSPPRVKQFTRLWSQIKMTDLHRLIFICDPTGSRTPITTVRG